MTTLAPRWTTTSDHGVRTARHALSDDLAVSLRQLSASVPGGADALMLAAHARVLSTLSGQSVVEVGHLGVEPPRLETHRLHVEATSWRSLITDAAQTLDAGGTPGTDSGAVDTAVLAPGSTPELSGPTLRLGSTLVLEAAPAEVVMTYRAEDLDAAAAARVVGYLVAALTTLTQGPDARADQQSLVSDEECRDQLARFTGPAAPLPDRRAHQLIEQQATRHPERIAARCAGVELSYGELDRRADRVADALISSGLQPEDVVAVVTERNLDWLVAVLAIFKAGGAYLPIEPHFPAERIATTLTRADCRLALTERASRAAVPANVRPLLVDELVARARPTSSPAAPRTHVGAEQLAYIYFTSGSTGQPKGAMCEHAGMLNHLLAKIEDLDVREGAVVAQVAPQCFDISLWQLISALLVGGTTVIVPQTTILDVAAFVELLRRERVEVMQVVPSYLEVMLTYLDQEPIELPDLRVVSVTGEAVKQELVERWFAARPEVALVNAYGLTETSDDTNHEVMHAAPVGSRVPLGAPIRNVSVAVVDADLRPVPLGAPGEIVFSGVCVGRGYVNDPERTAAAFVPDPHRPGERLYRSGDIGVWRPDGKLDFLGRRDNQLKISGFRIEIGEIENSMLGVDGVRNAAVVVTEQPDGSKALVGFYAADEPLDDGVLIGRLRELLPHYMVPPVLRWRAELPLSDNGKVDRKTLTTLATELAPSAAVGSRNEGALSAYEQRVAQAWSLALKRPSTSFGARDHFFDQGGSSLSAVKVVIGLDRVVTLKDVTTRPVLAELAEVLQRTVEAADEAKTDRIVIDLNRADLDGSSSDDSPVVLCFPPAAGNAVNFQRLAVELTRRGVRVLAVEPPGHDVSRPGQPLLDLPSLIDRVLDELASDPTTTGPLVVYGHSAGAVAALEAARRLETAGRRVDHVLLGAWQPGPVREGAISALAEQSDAQLGAHVQALAGQSASADADHLGRTFRHDLIQAYTAAGTPGDARTTSALEAPLTIVLADDDAATSSDSADASNLADQARVVRLPDGGHYFLRSRPEAVAGLVVESLAVGART